MDIVEVFLKTIKKYKMLEKGDKVLVGISGGPDSVCLLHLLRTFMDELDVTIFAAHLDHMFRGEESRKDAQFVKEICYNWSIPFFSEKIDVPLYVEENKISPEDAARRIRYNFYQKQKQKLGATKIALGHNRDDHEETVLMNILRGTGLEGLMGIAPVRDCYIRPLIEVPRSVIEDYLNKCDIPFRIDRTNLQPDYFRNCLRLELIPLIKERYCPHLGRSLRRLADIARCDLSYLEDETERILPEIIKYKGKKVSIDIKEFLPLHEAIKRRIVRKAIEYITKDVKDFEYKHTLMLVDFIESAAPGSLLSLPKNITGEKSYNNVYLYKGHKSKVPRFSYLLEIPGEIFIKEVGIKIKAYLKDFNAEDIVRYDSLIAYLDYDKIKGNLIVRNRRKGDKFRPLGFKGRKKLKDFFIDEKVPRAIRDKLPIVECNGKILWVCGMRIADEFKVTSDTKKVLVITAKQEE